MYRIKQKTINLQEKLMKDLCGKTFWRRFEFMGPGK